MVGLPSECLTSFRTNFTGTIQCTPTIYDPVDAAYVSEDSLPEIIGLVYFAV